MRVPSLYIILANEECWHACGKKLRKEQERIERAVSVFRFRVCVFSSSAINAHRAARCPWIQTIQTYRAGRAGGRPHRAPVDKTPKRNAASVSTTFPMCVCVCVSRAACLRKRSSFLAEGNSIPKQQKKSRSASPLSPIILGDGCTVSFSYSYSSTHRVLLPRV
eukprot:COSAG06_NODE_4176_length_4499_cov_111.892727_5_plen_164_part_00